MLLNKRYFYENRGRENRGKEVPLLKAVINGFEKGFDKSVIISLTDIAIKRKEETRKEYRNK